MGNSASQELTSDDEMYIRELFLERIVPRLQRMNARIGNVNCEFAGKQYRHWNIFFKSHKEGFDIVNIEYDENACGFNLDI